jgi:hypothetical protein
MKARARNTMCINKMAYMVGQDRKRAHVRPDRLFLVGRFIYGRRATKHRRLFGGHKTHTFSIILHFTLLNYIQKVTYPSPKR